MLFLTNILISHNALSYITEIYELNTPRRPLSELAVQSEESMF